ncbi:MAG: sigma-70 family RNA polymerase sigma factor [Candidatus Saccharibacteria bacterium]|nr:sigma-70 family RNA polymerase sigma factor [Candidatus Saccharibacteria bacterium]
MDETELFTQRYRENYSKVCGVIGRYVYNRSQIEDIASVVFISAWTNRASFKGRSKYTTWITRIAINYTLNTFKHKLRNAKTVQFDDAYHASKTQTTPEDLLNEQEARDRLQQCLMCLPKPYRETMLLWLAGNMDYKQIAMAVDVPIGTVRSRIHKGRRILEQRFGLTS